jgi:hypothetical protein
VPAMSLGMVGMVALTLPMVIVSPKTLVLRATIVLSKVAVPPSTQSPPPDSATLLASVQLTSVSEFPSLAMPPPSPAPPVAACPKGYARTGRNLTGSSGILAECDRPLALHPAFCQPMIEPWASSTVEASFWAVSPKMTASPRLGVVSELQFLGSLRSGRIRSQSQNGYARMRRTELRNGYIGLVGQDSVAPSQPHDLFPDFWRQAISRERSGQGGRATKPTYRHHLTAPPRHRRASHPPFPPLDHGTSSSKNAPSASRSILRSELNSTTTPSR